MFLTESSVKNVKLEPNISTEGLVLFQICLRKVSKTKKSLSGSARIQILQLFMGFECVINIQFGIGSVNIITILDLASEGKKQCKKMSSSTFSCL